MAEVYKAPADTSRTNGDSDPLAGLSVLEVGDYEAVQYCGRLLAALGATVFKAEPAEGDPLRRRPPFSDGKDGTTRSIPFEYLNAGKKGITLGLGTETGIAELNTLLAKCDVVLVVEEYLERLDLEHIKLSPEQLIVRVAVGVGGDRVYPTTAFTRFHSTINAYLIPADKDRSARPAWPGPYAFEIVHGTAIAAAVLSELRRDHGGEVDYSYQGYGLWLEKMFVPRVTSGQVQDLHRWDAAQAFGGVMACSDGWVSLFVIEEHQWAALCRMVGREDWLTDERFADGSRRVQNQEIVQAGLVPWFARHTADEVMAASSGTDIPLGRIRSLDQLVDWAPLKDRCFFQANGLGIGASLLPSFPYGSYLKGAQLGPFTDAGELPPAVRAISGPERPRARDESVGKTERPLAGLRVVDLTWAAAGPGITSLMAYLGGDVVKVEIPSRPDLMRIAGRQYGYGDTDLDHSPSFQEIGAGKRSIELNLRHKEDLETVRDLLRVADVFVENMRPGKVEEIGLSYEEVTKLNPRIIMCSQSGTGRTSGNGIPGYAPVFWAEGGGASVTGHSIGRPGIVRGPIDFHAATAAYLGVLALLRRRERTGEGGYIDCSAIECVVSLFGVELMALPRVDGREGNAFPGLLVNDVFPTQGDDEWIAVSIPDSAAWKAFTKVLQTDMTPPEEGDRDMDVVHEQLSLITERYQAEWLVQELRNEGVPAAASVSLGKAFRNPDLRARGIWQAVSYETVERLVVGLPWTYNRHPYSVPRKAPKLGEHTQEVLDEWLGEGRIPGRRQEERVR